MNKVKKWFKEHIKDITAVATLAAMIVAFHLGALQADKEQKKANAQTIEGKEFSLPQLAVSVPYAQNSYKALLQAGYYTFIFTNTNIQLTGQSYNKGPQPISYKFNFVSYNEGADWNDIQYSQDGQNTLFSTNSSQTHVQTHITISGKKDIMTYNGQINLTTIPERGVFAYSDEGIVNVQFFNTAGDQIINIDITVETAESPQTNYADVGIESGYPFYPLIGSGGLSNQASYNAGYEAASADKNAYGEQRYQAGKADGIASANEYTFERLISAVFDVPVQTVYGLFNFEILGVNILNFVLALLSLMVVVAILKLVV